MSKRIWPLPTAVLSVVFLGAACLVARAHDPLPSWNECAGKTAIIEFVTAVTDRQSPDFVRPGDRIASFDNDGTLWAEKPLVQLMFVFQRVRQMAEKNPSLKAEQPYRAVIENDRAYLEQMGKEEFLRLFVTTQSGMSQTEYRDAVEKFFTEAVTPSGEPLSRLRYRPQLELLDYLTGNGFKIYICSGGSVEFMRVISQSYYGIPPGQVIGTEFEYVFDETINDIRRLPALRTFNDKEEKPVSLQYRIGKRPIIACGNAGGAGDIQMLRFSQGGPHRSLQLIVNHDDPDREFCYAETDDKTLGEARRYGWTVISMKNDWNQIFETE